MLRSNNYDTLPLTAGKLKVTLKHEENILKKSVENNDFGKEAIETYNTTNDLSKAVYNQFIALRNDFKSGAINLVRYKENLQPLKDLLLDTSKPIKSKELHVDEIAAEIRKYL